VAKVAVERQGATTIVSIARFAEARNAVDPETAILLREAFLAFDADDTQSVAILTGRGGSFCAGYDLKVAASREGVAQHDPAGPGPMGPTRHLLSKPVIAAVEGYAVAGGLELALWCDLRVASESAQFGVFCRRWGVPLIDGGTVRLPRLVGQGRALEIIMTGRKVAADEALRIGLCETVSPKGGARAAAEAMAREIARFPQGAVRADRASAIAGHGLNVQEALRREWQRGVHTIATEGAAGAGRFAAGKGRGGDFSEI
jgi:enoyl-CoA hydratase